MCESGPGDSEKGRSFANLITSPELGACRVIGIMQPKELGEGFDVPAMLETLRDKANAVNRGDLAEAEAMLINQASALQSLFVRLTERAREQTQMPNYEGFMRLALRAQSQCRATLETLATIKNPPVVYAKQANVTTGLQQVNNGVVPGASRTRENEIQHNKLSGSEYELLPDTRASQDASRINQEIEAVGEINRAENTRR